MSSASLYQIPRNSLLWLMSAQAAVIVPHLQHLSAWLIVIWLVVVVTRLQIYRGAWNYPTTLVKVGLIIGCLSSIIAGYGRLFALEPMVAMLISAFLLKLLEMQRKRDALVLLYLGYFVSATQFLFAQTLWATLYGLFTVILLTTALLGIHQVLSHQYWQHSIKLGSLLVMQSIPLMVVLTLLLPKVGALWTVPNQRNVAKTGVSDSMSPGDFAQLSRSGALAFRVRFNGDIPPVQQLYWRGLVFSQFDGRTWRQGDWESFRGGPPVDWGTNTRVPQWLDKVAVQGEPLSYRISLEPTQQLWLYSLPLVVNTPGQDIGLTRDFHLIYRKPVRRRLHYNITSYPNYQFEVAGLPAWLKEQETALPKGFNPQSVRTAHQWWFESGGVDNYIQRVLQHYRDNFRYTLQPPALGRHSVDEFLWQTQSGFCEHFASSFVFMMRAAGIPARVVVGYQGGEINPLEEYVIVSQSNAHAWSEVWLNGKGWVRVDPTAAVAPERIESSLDDALDINERSLLGSGIDLFSYRHINWLNNIRLRLDLLNYEWQTWVVGFDSEAQQNFLKRWLGDVTPLKLALAFLGASGLVLSLVGVRLLLTGRREPLPPEVRLFRKFEAVLAKQGIVRQPGEGVQTFAARASVALPEWQQDIERVCQRFHLVAYRNNRSALNDLKQALRQLQRKAMLQRP